MAARVLVTGAGSQVGQGIMKSLRVSGLDIHLIATDISPFNTGLYRADEGLLLPKVEEAGALEQITAKIRKARAEIVFVGSEFDLEFFAFHREHIERETGAVCMVSPIETVRIANDKWLTTEFLRESGLSHANATLPSSVDEALESAASWGYPVILKTRYGTSSRHVHLVKDAGQLRNLFPSVPRPMLQKVIDLPSGELKNEYTCCVFTTADGQHVGPFSSRRTLRGGASWVLEVKEFSELKPLLLAIAARLPSRGSLNVQLMVGRDGPIPFEFNARISGSNSIRTHFGFNESAMAIRSFLRRERIDQPKTREGVALRYVEDVFLDGVSADSLREPFIRGVKHEWF